MKSFLFAPAPLPLPLQSWHIQAQCVEPLHPAFTHSLYTQPLHTAFTHCPYNPGTCEPGVWSWCDVSAFTHGPTLGTCINIDGASSPAAKPALNTPAMLIADNSSIIHLIFNAKQQLPMACLRPAWLYSLSKAVSMVFYGSLKNLLKSFEFLTQIGLCLI